MLKKYSWLIISMIAVGLGVFFTIQRENYDHKYQQAERQLVKLNAKVDTLKQKNAKVIYYPKAGNANLSGGQLQSVKWLVNFFTQATTFTKSSEYLATYNLARQHISDEDFYSKFMSAPSTNGVDNVSASGLRMQNIATQVLVVGPNTYEVYLSYVPYHSASDLYQKNKLDVSLRVFLVQGTGTYFNKVTLVDNLIAPYKTVGDLGQLL